MGKTLLTKRGHQGAFWGTTIFYGLYLVLGGDIQIISSLSQMVKIKKKKTCLETRKTVVNEVLSHEYGDPGFHPQYPHKEQGTTAQVSNSSSRKAGIGGP